MSLVTVEWRHYDIIHWQHWRIWYNMIIINLIQKTILLLYSKNHQQNFRYLLSRFFSDSLTLLHLESSILISFYLDLTVRQLLQLSEMLIWRFDAKIIKIVVKCILGFKTWNASHLWYFSILHIFCLLYLMLCLFVVCNTFRNLSNYPFVCF